MNKKQTKLISREDLPAQQVKIVVEILPDAISSVRSKAIKELSSNSKFSGFRSGQVPENIVVKKFGEKIVKEISIEIAVRENFPEILAEEKIAPLIPPSVSVEPTEDGGAKVTATITLLPKITLPDYRKISESVEKREIKITDDEVEKEIENLRRSNRHHHHTGEKDCAGCEEDSKPLEPITDDEARSFGDINDVADLKEKVRKAIFESKENREQNRRRQAIIEALTSAADPKIPEVVIERELDRLQAEFLHSLKHAKISIEKYLEETKKDIASLRLEWKSEAIRRATAHLLLPMIASEEKLVVNPNLVKSEAEALIKRSPGSAREDAEAYVSHLIRNELVLSFLENLGSEKK